MIYQKFRKKVVREKSCGVILFREKDGVRQFLLLHYLGGHWDFPKGHVEEIDPSEEATALRELEEETEIRDAKIFPGYREEMRYKFHRGRKEIVKKMVVYFVAETSTKEVKLSHEHQGTVWLNYEEALKKLSFENARELLRKAEKFLNS